MSLNNLKPNRFGKHCLNDPELVSSHTSVPPTKNEFSNIQFNDILNYRTNNKLLSMSKKLNSDQFNPFTTGILYTSFNLWAPVFQNRNFCLI